MSFVRCCFLAVVLITFAVGMPRPSESQQEVYPVGECFSVSGYRHHLLNTMVLVPVAGPTPQPPPTFRLVRDPSGLTFAHFLLPGPAREFIEWSGRVVLIRPDGRVEERGRCNLSGGFATAFPRPQIPIYRPPTFSDWAVDNENVTRGIPKEFVDPSQPFTKPLLASPEQAQQCMSQSGGAQRAFYNCMLDQMMSASQKEIYNCFRDSRSQSEAAVCAVGTRLRPGDRATAQEITKCYRENGTKWDAYPLCFAEKHLDPTVATVVHCARQDAQTNGAPTFWGTATCAGLSSLNLTPEQQITVECALSSGGNPLAFAGCSGGRLTARELEKCFTDGIGGRGCFGPNNEIVKALNNIGANFQDVLGPNNDLVRHWNNAVRDLQQGPGRNNEVVRVINTAARDVQQLGIGRNNEITKAVRNVFPGFKGFRLR